MGTRAFTKLIGAPMSDKLLVIGHTRTGLTCTQFLADTNLYEANKIFLELAPIQQRYNTQVPYQVADQTSKTIAEKLSNLAAWAEAGHDLFIVMDALPQIYFQTIRAGNTTVELITQFPLNLVEIKSASGTSVDWCNVSTNEALDMWVSKIAYISVIESNDILPLLRVKTAKRDIAQTVAGVHKHGKGRIFFVPPISDQDSISNYYRAIANLPELLVGKRDALPEWAAEYVTPTEQTAIAEKAGHQTQINKFNALLAISQQAINAENELKVLFAGTGTDFEHAIEQALTELGFKVVSVEGRRADRLASDGARLLAIEAKGLERGAKEDDLRQTDRWVADVRAALTAEDETLKGDPDLQKYAAALDQLDTNLRGNQDVICKGLMILGTNRKIPPSERPADDFPGNVTRAAERSDVCAMSGLELFALLHEARHSSKSKADLREMIFSTAGKFDASALKPFVPEKA